MRAKRLWPASTGWLIASVMIAPGLWLLDMTSMSLYWVARLPIRRPKEQSSPEALRRDVERSVSNRLATIRNRRQWKIALSLAVVGALAGPFVFGTYNVGPTYSAWVPLTAQQKANLAAFIQGTCQRRPVYVQGVDICPMSRDEYEQGGDYEHRSDLPRYLVANGAAAVAAFVSVFLLAFLIPTLVRGLAFLIRRYWGWLNA